MTPPTELPAFDAIAAVVHRQAHASEAHGLLCGMRCSDPGVSAQRWLAQIDADQPPSDPLLDTLYAATCAQLSDDGLGLRLLLPDDDALLAERAEALGHWCQGFLAGLALGSRLPDPMPPDAAEVLGDLARIAQVGFDAEDNDESDEEAYAEIIEYVRMGVLVVLQELSRRLPNPGERTH